MDLKNKRVVYHLAGMEQAVVRRNVEYSPAGGTPLTLDLYYPKDHHPGDRRGAVVIVVGYADVGPKDPGWCQFREMGTMVSWCQLFAASGMIGVVYETQHPAQDAHSVFSFLCSESDALGIAADRIGIYASSGNVPVALSILMDGKARCGALFCGMTLDLNGSTAIAEAAALYKFANPTTGKRVEDLPLNTGLFIARGGRDQFAGLNPALDTFVSATLKQNLDVMFVNSPNGPHGFDYDHDSEESRAIIRAALEFLRAKLGA